MAGHSKWKSIKHKKAIADSKRGKAFTKLIKEITIAARSGGDPAANPRLRSLLEKAKEINMPLENSQRAIKKGTGELPGVTYEQYMYEGYGPGNIAVLIEVLTDNKNRAIAELRALFTRRSAILAESGAVNWMFQKLGVIRVAKHNTTEDFLVETLLAHEVKDIIEEEDVFEITCEPRALEEIKQLLTKLKLTIESAEVEWVAQNKVELAGEIEEKAHEFLSALEDLEDVQNVYTNLA
jgi:YebC/PmpR family DNA-binding regulatory protein